MNMLYETERLRLAILSPSHAGQVLDFRLRNQEIFERYEAALPENFYTLQYQQTILAYEAKLAMKLSAVRFYVFFKDNPACMIGTVCLHDILRLPYSCGEIGYKFDYAYHHQGFAREAVAKVISVAFTELHLHRVFARVMPENTASLRLLEALHFTNEGLERSCLCIQGVWTDHLRLSLLSPC